MNGQWDIWPAMRKPGMERFQAKAAVMVQRLARADGGARQIARLAAACQASTTKLAAVRLACERQASALEVARQWQPPTWWGGR